LRVAFVFVSADAAFSTWLDCASLDFSYVSSPDISSRRSAIDMSILAV
jgi:hypothetical protein